MSCEYYLCPCGEKVEAKGVLTRCQHCGRRLDTTWRLMPKAVPLSSPVEESNVDENKPPFRTVPIESVEPLTFTRRKPPASVVTPTDVKIIDTSRDRRTDNVTCDSSGKLFLDYLGRYIPLLSSSDNNGDLGREGTGKELLEGNNLISRHHISYHVDIAHDRLIFKDISSNGTWYTHNGITTRVEKNELATLYIGDTLWLYNVPLVLRKED